MSLDYPIVAVTGSSGAGTTTVKVAFEHIFQREGINAKFVEGDSFFRYERDEMADVIQRSLDEGKPVSHFGPETNLLDELESLFRQYGVSGTGQIRHYVKDEEHEIQHNQPSGTFTPWTPIEPGTDLLFYEGLHGGVVASTWTRRRMSVSHNPAVAERRRAMFGERQHGIDVAQHVDLLLGVVPIINLEWIQKIDRDCSRTGCTIEQVTTTILRRMRDYIHYIVPQFSLTDINFQRVPMVDTSNPFIALDVPSLDESQLVIRFREPKKYDFPYLMKRIPDSYMSRPNTLVAPGGKMTLAMEAICTPIIHEMMERKRARRTG
jgi:phosphoribulokinase